MFNLEHVAEAESWSIAAWRDVRWGRPNSL